MGDRPRRRAVPPAWFWANAEIEITPLAFDGAHFAQKPEVHVSSPYQGDSVLSPSGKLVVSRLAGPGGTQLGYVLRKVNATPSGGTYAIQIPEVAWYCVNGAKPAISFDERWLVLHRYETNKSNLYLIDLLTGQETKITNMKPSQYALFPHWRSDNWIYFLVKDKTTAKEYVVASDAALQLE